VAAQPVPQPEQGQQQGQDKGQDPLQEFRALAEQVMAIGKKYPEAAQGSAQMLKIVQQMMTQVAGNAQRTPEKSAPPMA
jgi:flagellar biosynthesis/type III secretory pathway protein FliH